MLEPDQKHAHPAPLVRLSLRAVVFGIAMITGCARHTPDTSFAAPVSRSTVADSVPTQQLASPRSAPRQTGSAATPFAADTAHEHHVDVDTHGAEVDVRSLLDFVANAGNFKLVYSPGISQKVRVTLIDVPASVALKTLLSLANLTIESSTPDSGVPGSTSVVFYQLPVNVDSLSVESIMKRFGVGQTIAELIVQGRTHTP